jgi:hypothetical protein
MAVRLGAVCLVAPNRAAIDHGFINPTKISVTFVPVAPMTIKSPSALKKV